MNATPTNVTIRLAGQEHCAAWPRGTVLLDALTQAGIDVPYSCGEGSCGACVCRILRGTAEMKDNQILDAADLAEGYVLACQAVTTSDDVVVTYDD
ncbi:ferredoxin [Mycolicibacterium sp. BK556]|uniref:2Fe-2S iron-sulfur cluster-binding protein n=1 Tax=Mycobacteriaceae TaxID=1762 RepID=UPI00106040FD|nr:MULTISPECIES: 2Fe-2S iron-sulfur cluster binding domain-containing protein [Mycobacteriaceae]MBB3600401.1 ferredoxin [Mycolicibacterium sp. BK556]MBB3630153.1 ferredoxin [Mycolicibacterium sp. BK607]MBB3748151.1 ferredoxin [Mycolicibacterium sp. BK634]